MRKSPQFIYQSLPAVTGLIVAGIINVTGGNALQTFMGLTTTAMGGYASTALIKKDTNILDKENREFKEVLGFKPELDDLKQQRELLMEKINNLKIEEEDLERRIIAIKRENYNLEELEKRVLKSQELKTEINELTGELNTIKQQIKEREYQRDNLSLVSSQFLQKQAELDDLKQHIDKLSKSKENLEVAKVNYEALNQKYTILENERNKILKE
ncbi:hypothetical protein [Cyanobacterium aponinum]|uniref:Uncharacterized protein n=1 Tax=Cyanobacterium aponinum (strain PCC 10605) TaxID=755178 RepID=K9Z8X2_CYAAP|nr:hypothetical protein [Cyanobacterium aponinum]AFZ54813.1 hypothetical protein Cyan10605_2741 [Cyanobacterium aponinum PCC 10605]